MNIIIELLLWITYLASLYFSVFLLIVYLEKRSEYDEPIEETEENKESNSAAFEPFISILVPAYNEEKTIQKTLESINHLDYPKNKVQIIVINDGSKDQTEQMIKSYITNKPPFQLLSHSNKGKAASLNIALKLVKGEFFACLDADSFVHPTTLRKMLKLYHETNDPSLAIITPAMKVHDPKTILQRVQWLEYLVLILMGKVASKLDSLYVAPGPFSLYNTTIIKQLGGFDEKNITEDQEIAYRVQKHHYKIRQCPAGYVYTTAPATLKPFCSQRKRWYLGSMLCVHQYHELIANRKYGDFGMMQMVKNASGYFLAITGISIAFTLFLQPWFSRLREFFLVDFNLLPYILDLKLKFNFLTFLLTDFRKAFIIIFLILIGAYLFYAAHKNAHEKITKFGWLHLIPYFAFYYSVKAYILMITLVKFAWTRKAKW